MFTLLPSLYLIGVHYFRQWNQSYHDEQEEKIFETNDNSKNTSKTIRSTKLVDKYNDTTTTNVADYEKNGYLPRAASNYHDGYLKGKSRRKRSNRSSSSLFNAQRRKSFTGELSDDDIMYLKHATEFTNEQILVWHHDYLHDCPNGKLSKSKFIEIYKQFYKKGQVTKFCEHAFRIFNTDGSGYMDFIEFLLAVSWTSSKDPIKKIELFFYMYDIDCNGLIDENEMRCVVESIYELMGIDTRDPSRIDTKVNEIFSRAECDQSGYLRKDQFALACQNDRHIRKLLIPNTQSSKNQ